MIGGVPNYQFFDCTNGELRPFIIGAQSGFPQITFGGDGDSEVPNPNLSTVPSLERYVLNAIANYDLSDRVNAYVEAKYGRSRGISTRFF